MTRWLAILLLVVAGALVFTVLRQRQSDDRSPRPMATPRAITPPQGDLGKDEQQVIEMFDTVSPSVVHITSLESRRSRLSMNVLEMPQGTGSGFIWDTDGHVVTNFHVIQNADRAEVTLSDNSVWKAEIVGSAPDKDLAVLRINAPADKLRPIAIGVSSNLRVGQSVFAIGNPFGLDQTLTTGVISGLGREIQSVTKRPIYDVIQTDAPINPGNSGGPLLDSHGRLIGVNTAIYSPSGAYAGIGFAVPVDSVNLTVPQLVTNGRLTRPGLGIHIGSDQMARALNLKGVIVFDIQAGSAAARAGLAGITNGQGGRWLLGDVVVALDSAPVTSSSDLFRALDQHKVGDTVKLTVERDGKKRDVELTLQALP
jgi:S1-C subfamily serine protease